MARIYVSIPFLYPPLEISCKDEKLMEYICRMFMPYINQHPSHKVYHRMHFYKNAFGKLVVEENDGSCFPVDRMVSYIESFLLKQAVVEEGYVMLHGGAIEKNNKAYILLADSFGGKSTATAYLCMKNFRYITDDRVIINTESRTILPYPKTIMLRPGTRALLQNEYDINIPVESYRYRGIERDFYLPTQICTESPKVKNICVLSRYHCPNDFRVEYIEKENRIKYLLRSSHNVSGFSNLKYFMQLSTVDLSVVHYYYLNDLKAYLDNI